MKAKAPDSIRAVMLPPAGFIEDAVANALAAVTAEEALMSVDTIVPDDEPENDIIARPPRKRRDSGVIPGVIIDETPTLPLIPAVRVPAIAALDE